MKMIDTDADSLFEYGKLQYQIQGGKAVLEVFKNIDRGKTQLSADLLKAHDELLLRVVAIMIEQNNEALRAYLKTFEVFQDDET
jgi:hypothetical protein